MVETPAVTKRRRSPSLESTRLSKRPRTRGDAEEATVPTFIQRLTMQVFSMFRRPSSDPHPHHRAQHTSSLKGIKLPSSDDAVIDLAASDSDDDVRNEEAHRRQVDRRRTALQHLNDHLGDRTASPTTAGSAIHPNLPGPLFPSSLGFGLSAPASTGRPNVSVRPPTRTYAWATPAGSTASLSGNQVSHKAKSHRSDRNSRHADKASQNVILEQLRRQMEEKGDSEAALAVQRIEAEWDATSTRKAKKGRKSHRTSQAPTVLDSFGPDMRLSLDEAVARPGSDTRRAISPVYPRRSWHPVESISSPLHDKQRIQRIIEEEDIKKRLKATPSIPPDVTAEQKEIVSAALGDDAFEARVGNAQINATSIRRLKPGVWLNDEVVNIYAELITQRARAGKGKKVFCWNSYLYEKLSTQGYAGGNLKRWTKRHKLDMFELDQMLIPINHGNSHWVCAVVNFSQKRFEYYDSLHDSGRRREVFRLLREYIQAEHREKKGSDIDLSDWQDAFNPDSPKQDNANDCGVFACQTLEMVARGCDLVADRFEFGSRNMPFFRRLMVVEIASGELASRSWAKL